MNDKKCSKPQRDFAFYWNRFWCSVVGFIIIAFFVIAIFVDNDDSRPRAYSNQVIASRMVYYFYMFGYDTKYYKPEAEILKGFTSEGKIWFYLTSQDDKYKLNGPYGYLNDTTTTQEMHNIIQKYHEKLLVCYLYNNNLKIMPNGTPWQTTNRFLEDAYYMYSTKSDKELQEDYKNYKLYDTTDTVSNDYNGGWLKRIEENWYIVSPDSLGNDYYY